MPLAVCATPIGNLGDVTLRVLEELRAADIVLCEDTRHTRILLDRYEISARLLSFHEHNEAERTPEVLRRLEAGERVALVSDAGLPGISDPGTPLVRAALAAGLPVTVLPGPSAVETALVASGLGGGRFTFVGFLPRRAGELAALWEEVRAWEWPLVAFESPRRLPATLRSLARGAARAARRGVPGADEAVRGGRARVRRRARSALRRAAEGRDHARRRSRRGVAVDEAASSRGRRGGRRARGGRDAAGARRRGRLAPDRRVRATTSTGILVTASL